MIRSLTFDFQYYFYGHCCLSRACITSKKTEFTHKPSHFQSVILLTVVSWFQSDCARAPNSTSNSSRKSSPTLLCSSSSHSTSLSQFLDDTALSTPKVSPASSHQPRAKLFTSMSFIAMLEEKEKKNAASMEKNKRE